MRQCGLVEAGETLRGCLANKEKGKELRKGKRKNGIELVIFPDMFGLRQEKYSLYYCLVKVQHETSHPELSQYVLLLHYHTRAAVTHTPLSLNVLTPLKPLSFYAPREFPLFTNKFVTTQCFPLPWVVGFNPMEVEFHH